MSFRALLTILRVHLRRAIVSLLQRLPRDERRFVFSSFSGRGYTDSPKALYEFLAARHPDKRFIWALRDPNGFIPGRVTKVKYGGLRHFYYMATSRYWISNARLPHAFRKRPGTIHLQTWHGTPLKKLGFDIEEAKFGGPNYEANLQADVAGWDFLLSQNHYSTEVFQSAFRVSAEQIWEIGYPRNDVLFEESNDQKLESIRRRLNISSDKKVVLYAPTWRDREQISPGVYRFRLELDLVRLRERIGNRAVVLLRMHYHSENQLSDLPSDGFAIDVSSYPNLPDLFLISDILVTDYSSVMFDYSLLRRPIIIFSPDIQEYRRDRGLYFELEKTPPGAIVQTQRQLEEELHSTLEGRSWTPGKYDSFFEKFCSLERGMSCRGAVERLLALPLPQDD